MKCLHGNARNSDPGAEEIRNSLLEGVGDYFADCKTRVPDFVDKHFRYPGALHLNRVAFGWDLLRAPLNLFWAPVYALVCLLRYALGNSKIAGLTAFASLLEKIPSGFTTKVQKSISNLVVSELLHDPARHHAQATLKHFLINSLRELYAKKYQRNAYTDEEGAEQFYRMVEPLVRDALLQYQVTRTASADIGNTLSCAILGAFAFKKFTPGGIGIGLVVAALLAEKFATRDFILGETLGEIYYGYFPPQPSLSLLTFSLLAVMACLSVIAAFSGIVTDPVQARLGFHQRRLYKLLDALEKDVVKSTRNSFRPKDQFVARILDAFDVLKSGFV